MYKKSKILNNLPKTIVLKLKKNLVTKLYGEIKNIKQIEGKKLKTIFSKNAYKHLKKLKSKSKQSVQISWNQKKYEVYFKKNIFYFYDITQFTIVQSKFKKNFKDLISKKEELQAVFDLAANGISILNRDGIFLYANKFFQNMIEYSMEELYEKSCITLSAPEYAKPSKTAVQKAIQYGTIEKFRKVCVTKSGKYLNASMSLAYLESRDEIIMITSDITEDIKYQDKLKQKIEQEVKKRVEQYEVMFHQSRLASMGEMINSIAHQWRQPLNGLGIVVQGLRHLSAEDKVDKEFLKEIEVEMMQMINYMSQTIDDFSTFFKLSREKEKFELLQSIQDVIRLLDPQIKEQGIEIYISSKKNINLNILGYPNEFRQVVLNILHNSISAIVDNNIKKGIIDISIKSNKKNVTIKILDNGGGIKKENIEKVFDPYFTTKEKGSGIGLYMSKVIIENHMDGLLQVKNKKDGVEFIVLLPFCIN